MILLEFVIYLAIRFVTSCTSCSDWCLLCECIKSERSTMINCDCFDSEISTRRISSKKAFSLTDKRLMTSLVCSKSVTKSLKKDTSCWNSQSQSLSFNDLFLLDIYTAKIEHMCFDATRNISKRLWFQSLKLYVRWSLSRIMCRDYLFSKMRLRRLLEAESSCHLIDLHRRSAETELWTHSSLSHEESQSDLEAESVRLFEDSSCNAISESKTSQNESIVTSCFSKDAEPERRDRQMRRMIIKAKKDSVWAADRIVDA